MSSTYIQYILNYNYNYFFVIVQIKQLLECNCHTSENPMEFVSFVKILPLAKLKPFQCLDAIQSDSETSKIL